jgi:hypothetical protein
VWLVGGSAAASGLPEVVFLLRGFRLPGRGMTKLTVVEGEVERSCIEVNREVGIRM